MTEHAHFRLLRGRAIMALGTGALQLTACGAPSEFRCDETHTDGFVIRETSDPVCTSAVLHAAKDSAELIPTQEEIDRYYDRLRRVDEAAAALRYYLEPPLGRYDGIPGTTIHTRNPSVIAAWEGLEGEPAPPTGDPVFDEAVSMLEVTIEHWWRWESRDYVSFGISVDRLFNDEVLHQRLLPTSSWLPEPVFRLPDAYWRWIDADGTGTDDATAEIFIVYGWGDCFAGCAYYHQFLATVPPDAPARVADIGGDPLPPGWELNPSTPPAP